MANSQGAADVERFAYHRQLAPMLWALMAIGLVELGVVHLLLSHWSMTAALLLSAVSGSTLIYLAAQIRSFKRLPVEASEAGVRVRTGMLIDAFVALEEIASVRSGHAGGAGRSPSRLKASLLAYPNVSIELRRELSLPGPFGRRRSVQTVALALDEPARFAAAVKTRLQTPPRPPL